ncbi:MAG: sensor histidine kinase [Geodermatophilales bacterium]|jgi:anti-sigma regulatory factor (Ser/Thr protein kinase)|nr:sensor histidine kinase [Geodermatophilales bacterium]
MTALLEQPGFEHEALFYRGEEGFLADLVPFVLEGLAREEAVLVAEPRSRLDLLRDALADDARAVSFLDMEEVGANPARILGLWAAALEEQTRVGRTLRGVGEPAWYGRREAELVESGLHEQLLNRAFDDGPAWRLLCPYDEERLPRAVCDTAVRTHPLLWTGAGRSINEDYRPDGDAFAAVLPRPQGPVLRGTFGPCDVPATRRTVAQYARSCGLTGEQVEALTLAASELATNSIRHGGGAGTVAMWVEPGAAVVEFSDAGHVPDPLTGRRPPPPDTVSGRGLYLVNQLCDLVQLRSSPGGTTVRITTWL